MKQPVPTFAAFWEPPAPGTVLRRPVLIPERSAPPQVPDQFDGVAYLVCRVCGHRWGKNPTRCMCPHATTKTAPPVRDAHWTDEETDR